MWFLGCPTMKFCGQTSSAEDGRFTVGTFPANLGLGIVKLWVILVVSSNLATGFPVLDSTGSPIVAVGLLAYTFFFLKKKRVLSLHLVQMDLQKTFPGILHKSCASSCGLKSWRGFPKNSEQQKEDSARGMIQSCWPFQDPENIHRHSEILIYRAVPEFEPWAYLLWSGFPAIRVGSTHPFVFPWVPSALDQQISFNSTKPSIPDLCGRFQIVENEVVCPIHGWHLLHVPPSTHAFVFQIFPLRVSDSFAPQEAHPEIKLRFREFWQGFMFSLDCFLCSDFWENSNFLWLFS